jgi:putative endopeptidase
MILPWIRLLLCASLLASSFLIVVRAADRAAARSGVDPSGFDTAVRPQDDFFRYINGGWIARTTIPADRSAYGSFFALRDKSESNLRTMIEQIAAMADNPAGPEARKLGDLYASFMDEARANELGKKPAEADFARIDAITDKASHQHVGVASARGRHRSVWCPGF